MPAPFIIVTFKDADGDEFPIRVPGNFAWSGGDRVMVIDAAHHTMRELIDAGELRPTYPVTVAEIEQS
jgi:hypothetical protein